MKLCNCSEASLLLAVRTKWCVAECAGEGGKADRAVVFKQAFLRHGILFAFQFRIQFIAGNFNLGFKNVKIFDFFFQFLGFRTKFTASEICFSNLQ